MIFISISFISCQSPSNSTLESDSILSITIEAKEDKISLPLSEITEKVDVIALETNEFSLINKEIQSIHILKDYIIIKDASPGVLVFDTHGNFVRRIGQQGQGPGELYAVLYIQIDFIKSHIWFWLFNKIVIFDINGNFVKEIIRDKLTSYSEYYYYYNDSIFIINAKEEKLKVFDYSKEISFLIRPYPITNYSEVLLDSLPIMKYSSEQKTDMFKTIFQHQGQVYMLYAICCNEEYNYLYVIKKNKFVPFVRFLLESSMRGLIVTDRYAIVTHGNITNDKRQTPQTITPDIIPALRNQSTEHDFSYYVYDFKTKKNYNSYNGFIDDIHHIKEIISIKFIDGGDKFFYTTEGEWSEYLKCELNPMLYIGTFKK